MLSPRHELNAAVRQHLQQSVLSALAAVSLAKLTFRHEVIE